VTSSWFLSTPYLRSFYSSCSTFISSRIPSFLLCSKRVHRLLFWKISSSFLSFFILLSTDPNFATMYKNGESQIIIFKIVVQNSQYLSKFYYFRLIFFSFFLGNFKTELFKLSIFRKLFLIHNYFTSYWLLSWKYRLRFFWWYFHSKIACIVL